MSPASSGVFPTGRSLLRVVAVARWLSWVWMAAVVAFSGDALRHRAVAWLVVAVGLSIAVVWTVWLRVDPARLLAGPALLVEAVFALTASVLDGWVFEPGHVFVTSQNLAAQWPAVAAASIGIAVGPVIAAGYGVLAGPARWVGAELNGFTGFEPRHVVSLVAVSAFTAAVGGVIGWLAGLLRRAEAEIADRRARDEVAAVLHDTVLQTLAQVERRTAATDPELAAAARASDRQLRRFLFGGPPRPSDLRTRLVRAVDAARDRWPGDVQVTVNVVASDCRVGPREQDGLAGAVGEAVANALEHSGAADVVVFAETDDDGAVFCSVRDDGAGFDPASGSGHGLDVSVVARVAALGGRAEITSSPGRGTEVRLWMPAR